MKHLKVEQAAVMLLERASFHTMVRKVDSKVDGLPYRLDAQLTGWMLKNLKPLLINDLQNDERFQISKGENVSIRSLLAVPLQQKGKMIGLLERDMKDLRHMFKETKGDPNARARSRPAIEGLKKTIDERIEVLEGTKAGKLKAHKFREELAKLIKEEDK